MEFTVQQIAVVLNGTIEGNAEAVVSNISKIEEGKPGTLSFLANPAYTKYIYTTEASAVLVRRDFSAEQPIKTTLIRVDDPYQSFTKLLQMVDEAMKLQKNGIATTAIIGDGVTFSQKESVWISEYVVIGKNVKIGKGVKIYPQVFIDDNSVIGDNSILYSGVKMYHSCVLGNNCILHSGVVVGSDGFGFAPLADGSYTKIPQLGNVIIEDNIEIGANACIDRATIGSTVIRKGTKLDNLIQVAHNCEIGNDTVIAAQSGFSGSTKVGSNCMIGGQVGVAGHLHVGNRVMIAAQSGIAGNIADDAKIMGSPAFDALQYKKSAILFKNLEKMNNRIKDLEAQAKKSASDS
jgi:UDP-3-O-[3-hydroxymyristoyl] glucosamine N-acyltransferase